MTTIKSSSMTSLGALDTPLTSPSELTSPISTADITANAGGSTAHMLAFQSDPSLPALLSGASSISNDVESELLNQPGIVTTRTALLETTDSLTPPAIDKATGTGFPLEQALESGTSLDSGLIPLRLDSQAVRRDRGAPSPRSRPIVDDDDGSDSDEGLHMMKTVRKKKAPDSSSNHRTLFTARRRDTNASIGSTETAKKVIMHSEETPSQER
jgi:[calcium/calmodulin-dependent protein kinase] kinase